MKLEDMALPKCAAERHAGSNPAIPKIISFLYILPINYLGKYP